MARQGLVMMLLTLLAQMLLMISMLWLARCYPPAALGQLSQLSATLLLLSPVAALCLPFALVTTKAGRARTMLFQFSHFLVICTALLFSVSANLLVPTILPFHPFANFVLLFLGFYLLASQQTWQQWAVASFRYQLAGAITLLAALSLVLSRFVAATLQWPIELLLLLTLGSPFIALVVSSREVHVSGGVLRPSWLSWRSAKRLFSRHRNFVLWQSPQLLLNSFAMQLPLLCFASWYGLEQAGYYALALAILAAPAGVINKSVGDYLYPKLAALRGQARHQLFRQATIAVIGIAILPLAWFFVYAEVVIELLFGSAWLSTAAMSKYLIPWFCLLVANAPALKVLMLQQRQRLTFFVNAITLLLRITGLWLCYLLEQPILVSMAWLTLCGLLHNAVLIALAWRITRLAPVKGSVHC